MGTPLLTVAQLRTLEASARAGLAPGALMQRAGAAAARAIHAHFGTDQRSILVVCGPGNNGGDGYVCATELARAGFDVSCVAPAPPTTEDARAAHAQWCEIGGTVVDHLAGEEAYDAIVDAMFGIGLARPLSGWYLDAAHWIAHQHSIVFALDVPSGLDSDRGTWVGGVPGIHAHRTITFLAGKPGLCTGRGCDAAGRVLIERLDVEGAAPERSISLVTPADFANVCAPRRRDTHKGSFGNLAVVGGGVGMVGASLLAARAALRLGAGRVFVDCIGAPEMRCDPVQPELMFRSLSSLGEVDAVVAGCGLGTDAVARTALLAVLEKQAARVLDADALNLVASDSGVRAQLERTARDANTVTVLTPHPLEAARLLGCAAAQVQEDRVGAARRLAAATRALVVLKGAGTVIATPDERTWINSTGGPALATPGTGDALAGMLGALLAQGYAPLEAVLAGVYLHGAAGEECPGDIGLVASEVAELSVRRLQRLRRERTR